MLQHDPLEDDRPRSDFFMSRLEYDLVNELLERGQYPVTYKPDFIASEEAKFYQSCPQWLHEYR